MQIKRTKVDDEILKILPNCGWFNPRHLPFNKPEYRCERLETLGLLERKVSGKYPFLVTEYRKLTEDKQ